MRTTYLKARAVDAMCQNAGCGCLQVLTVPSSCGHQMLRKLLQHNQFGHGSEFLHRCCPQTAARPPLT